MTYSVRSSQRVDADLTEIFDWIARRSPDGALHWLDAFEAAVRRLQEHADQASRAPEADEFGIDLRQLIFRTRRGRPYRVLFIIRDEIVHLAALRGPGHDNVTRSDLELPE